MIYIARHGQTDWNLERKIQGQIDVPLNKTGRQEAVMCGKQLSSVKIDKIVSSDLSRATETANIINESLLLSLPVNIDTRLKELNCGNLEGKVLEKEVPWHTFINDLDKFHSEPLTDFYNRLKSFFEETDAPKNTLVVTHTGVVKMIMYLANNPNSYNKDDFEKIASEFKVKNGDIFTWDKVQKLQLFTKELLVKNLKSLEY